MRKAFEPIVPQHRDGGTVLPRSRHAAGQRAAPAPAPVLPGEIHERDRRRLIRRMCDVHNLSQDIHDRWVYGHATVERIAAELVEITEGARYGGRPNFISVPAY